MPYSKTEWKDRVISNPLTYSVSAPIVAGTPFTLIPEEGTITETGTPLNSANLNHLESQYEQALEDALPRTGGTVSGDLTVTGTTTVYGLNLATTGNDNYPCLTARADPDTSVNSGFGVSLGVGGTTVVGGGESAKSILNDPTLVPNPATERLLLTSDNEINMLVGMQDVLTDPKVGKRFSFASNGDFGLGGNNADAVIGVIKYNPATKTYSMVHWTGTATQLDTILSVGDINYNASPINLPLAPPVVIYSDTSNCVYLKKGNTCYVWGAVKGLTAIGVTIATLPVNYRPSRSVSFAMPTSGKNFARWTISTDGRIVMENVSQTTAPTATDWFPINFTFPLD